MTGFAEPRSQRVGSISVMRSRLVSLALLASLTFAVAVPVTATEEAPQAETTAEVTSDYQPAVEVDLFEAEDAGTQPWTTRFLVPTTLLLAAIVIFLTVVQYFTKVVRARYKVVE